MEDLAHVHPILKKLFSKQKIPKCALAGRIKEFLPATDKRSRALGCSRRLPNLSSNETISGEGSKNTKFKSVTTKTSRFGSKGNAGKGLHFKSLSLEREIFEQFFSEQQKRWTELTSHKLKDLNRFIPYKHFKMEGLHCVKYVLQKKDYMFKVDLKDAYFKD